MGLKRRDSQKNLAVRLTRAVEMRETLHCCEACGGAGFRNMEFDDGTYRHAKCKWCEGGMTDKVTYRMYLRWKRIHAHNLRQGKCSSTQTLLRRKP